MSKSKSEDVAIEIVVEAIKKFIADKVLPDKLSSEIRRLASPVKLVRQNSSGSRIAFLVECSVCGKTRWRTKSRYISSIVGMPKTPGICITCYSSQRAELHSTWRGGRTRSVSGYTMIKLQPDDPYFAMANCANYVFEHRLVVAKHLGRTLKSYELVHHINHIRDDNRIENLKLITTDNHNQFTVLETRIIKLERKVQQQQWQISLLLWWLGEIKSEQRQTTG